MLGFTLPLLVLAGIEGETMAQYRHFMVMIALAILFCEQSIYDDLRKTPQTLTASVSWQIQSTTLQISRNSRGLAPHAHPSRKTSNLDLPEEPEPGTVAYSLPSQAHSVF